MAMLLQRGVSPLVAQQGGVALHFLDDDYEPSRSFERAVRRVVKSYAKALGAADTEDVPRLVEDTLIQLRDLADEHDEYHYHRLAAFHLERGQGDDAA